VGLVLGSQRREQAFRVEGLAVQRRHRLRTDPDPSAEVHRKDADPSLGKPGLCPVVPVVPSLRCWHGDGDVVGVPTAIEGLRAELRGERGLHLDDPDDVTRDGDDVVVADLLVHVPAAFFEPRDYRSGDVDFAERAHDASSAASRARLDSAVR
jgi:hypothetical protein